MKGTLAVVLVLASSVLPNCAGAESEECAHIRGDLETLMSNPRSSTSTDVVSVALHEYAQAIDARLAARDCP